MLDWRIQTAPSSHVPVETNKAYILEDPDKNVLSQACQNLE